MAHRFTKSQLADLQDIFDAFDGVGDNKIYVDQVGDCLRVLDENPTEVDIKRYTQHLEPGERVPFEVFLKIYNAISKDQRKRSGGATATKTKADALIEALRHFDEEGTGYMPAAQLRRLLTTMGEKLTYDEAEQLLAHQTDLHGNVNYQKFIRMILYN